MRKIPAKSLVARSEPIGSADTLLLGRRTYDSVAGAWPDREAAGGEDATAHLPQDEAT